MRITLVKTDGQKRQKVSEKTFIGRDDHSWLAEGLLIGTAFPKTP